MVDERIQQVLGKEDVMAHLEKKLEELLEAVRARKVHQCVIFADMGHGIKTTTVTCRHDPHVIELVEIAFEQLDNILETTPTIDELVATERAH